MRITSWILTFFLAIGLAACDKAPPAGENTPAENAETPTIATSLENSIDIHLNEYRYELDQDTFVVGVTYDFNLINDGAVAHEWAVVPRGAETEEAMLIEVEDDELPAGASHRAAFAFTETGDFDFVCFMEEPVSHDSSGMRAPITVVEADR